MGKIDHYPAPGTFAVGPDLGELFALDAEQLAGRRAESHEHRTDITNGELVREVASAAAEHRDDVVLHALHVASGAQAIGVRSVEPRSHAERREGGR